MSENVDSYEGEVPHEVYIRRRIVAVILFLLALLLIIGLVSWLSGRGGDSKETAGASTSTSAEAFSDFSQRPTESASASSSADAQDEKASAEASSSEAEAQESAEASKEASAEASPSEAQATPTAQPTTAEPTPAPTTAQAVAACNAADLQVTLTADRETYGAGQFPALAVTYTNASGNPCIITGGANNVDVNIISGPAQVYNYAQCNSVATADAEIAAGATSTTPLTWNRQLNVLGCNTPVTIQPGYYWATASVNGVASQPVRIIVTG